jgi:5-methylcytosine-specific restriction endonuclease McrA
MSSFENSLVMTVDFVHPRAQKGKKNPENLITACQPCNVIKGERILPDFEQAKAYVLKHREELRKEWEAQRPIQANPRQLRCQVEAPRGINY